MPRIPSSIPLRLVTAGVVGLTTLGVGGVVPRPAQAATVTSVTLPCGPPKHYQPTVVTSPTLSLKGPVGPYTSHPNTYCGILALPGTPSAQLIEILEDGRPLISVQVGMDERYQVDLSFPAAGRHKLQSAWQAGTQNEVDSQKLVVQATSTPDPARSSVDLINAAVAGGILDAPTALAYRIFAVFDQAKLPASYRSNVPVTEVDDSGVQDQVIDGWSTLSAAQQASVLPYLGPYQYPNPKAPAAPVPGRSAPVPTVQCDRLENLFGSQEVVPPFDASPPGWASFGTAHFKIWYLTHDVPYTTAAQSLTTAQLLWIEAEKVYVSETALFGRVPPPDDSQPCNGGDGRLDIFAIRNSDKTGALTDRFVVGCQLVPSYIAIAPDYANTALTVQYALAHEFFHTMQIGAYKLSAPCPSYDWLGEATANWAVDYVYPTNNLEQRQAQPYFAKDYVYPIEQGNTDDPGLAKKHGYEDYLYLFYLSHHLDQTVIPAIWNATAADDALHALNDGTPGGFAANWSDFALDNWNRAPLDHYTAWDNIPYQLSEDHNLVEVDLNGQHQATFPLPATFLAPRASDYTYITVVDANVAALTFHGYGWDNPSPPPTAQIKALVEQADGNFSLEDWSDGADRTFCRNKTGQDIVSVLIMASDASVPPETEAGSFGAAASVSASDFCVPDAFTGKVSGSIHTAVNGDDVTESWSGNATFAYNAADSVPLAGTYIYNSASGSVSWSVSGTVPNCAIQAGPYRIPIGPLPPPGQPAPGPVGQIQFHQSLGLNSPYYAGGGWYTTETATWTCSPGGTFQGQYAPSATWWTTSLNGLTTSQIRKRQILSGTDTETDPLGDSYTWTWNMKPVYNTTG